MSSCRLFHPNTGTNPNNFRMREHGPPETGERTKQYQRENWACVNKTPKGIFLMAAEAKYQMQREGVTPDTIVFPPRMGMYAKWADERISYKESGPKADVTLYGEALTMPRILGCDVFESKFGCICSLGKFHSLIPNFPPQHSQPRHLMSISAPAP